MNVANALAVGGETLEKVFPGSQHVAVIDHARGLMWAADDVCAEAVTFEEAEKSVAKLRLEGHADWRLPTIEELLSCVDYTRHDPAANTDLHRVKSVWYWTSTPAAWAASARWFVHFFDGGSFVGLGLNSGRVRAVRSVPVALSGQ